MHDTEPVTPAQPVTPSRKRRTGVGALVLAAVLCCVAYAILADGSHHPHKAAPVPSATVTGTVAAPAVTAMSAWCAGAGDAALRHVTADLGQVGADANAGNLAATEADGTRMATDAEAAGALPPPVTHAQQVSYTEAMGAFSFAGIDLAAGSLTAANRAITAASGYLNADKGIISC